MCKEEAFKVFAELLGTFAFHLSDTHGIPLEIMKERLMKAKPESIYLLMLKHKDFKWKYKKE